MRRPQTAFGFTAVIVSLVVATLSPIAVHAAPAPAEPAPAPVLDAKGRCTVWNSQYVPPKTIRVLRTKRDMVPKRVAGTVQEVDFRDYVAVTMAVEWPERYPGETLRAGAIATKQFAWYYVRNWRGGVKWKDGKKQCYDVVDTWVDQYYYPEKYGIGKANGPGPKIDRAIAETWHIHLRKFKPKTQSSRQFLTGYRAGDPKAECGQDATGFKLFHNSTRKCGENGLEWREILRTYLKPNLEIVDPGEGDAMGTRHGDATAMVRNGSSQWVAHAWPKARDRSGPGAPAGIKISTADLVGFGAADVNNDGDDDLIWFRQTGNKTGKIKVALSNGRGAYGQDLTWWEGDTIVPLASARLLIGDFHADERVDVALLGKGDDNDRSRLVVFRRKPWADSKKFADPQQHWQGWHDNANTAGAWAADLSGDGRADLVIRQNPGSGGVRIKTAVTKSPLPMDTNQRTNGLKVRYDNKTLNAAKVRMTAGDFNRDGRDDMLLLIGGSSRTKIDRLQGQRFGGFKRVRVWTAPKSDNIPVRKTRIGTADVDYDGITDLILYTERTTGTRVRVLKSGYDRMVAGPSWNEGSLPWSALRPF